MERNSSFEEKVYKGSLLYCIRSQMEKAKELGNLTENQILKVA